MRVAVCGEGSTADRVEALVESVDSVRLSAPQTAAVLLAVGARAVSEAVRTADGRPILPVALGPGPNSVAVPAVADTLETIAAGDVDGVRHRTVAVSIDGRSLSQAVFDLALVTKSPAHISEYGVHPTRGAATTFRSDGVVVATPFGSSGYARAAGGVLVDATAGVSVVPISPFAISTDRWVHRLPIELSIERDDDISVIVDGSIEATATVSDTVRIEAGGEFDVVTGGAARSNR
ncbi:MAG: hypothetical protein ACQETB_03335 [Halobacteriota archaeon]